MVFQCNFCGKQFIIRSSLTWHIMKSVCSNQVKGSCNLSSFNGTCTENNKDVQHDSNIYNVAQVPTANGPHKCDICGNQFLHVNNLRAHRKLHKGDEHHANQFILSSNLPQPILTLSRSNFVKQETNDGEHVPKGECKESEEIMNSGSLLKNKVETLQEVIQSHHVSDEFKHPSGLSVIQHIKTERDEIIEQYRQSSRGFNSISEDTIIQSENFTSSKSLSPIKHEACSEGFTTADHNSQNVIVHTEESTISSGMSLKIPIKTEFIECDEELGMTNEFYNCLPQENIFQTERHSGIPQQNKSNASSITLPADIKGNEIVPTDEFTGASSHKKLQVVATNDFQHTKDEQLRISPKFSLPKKLYIKSKSYHCGVCNKEFTCLADLSRHKSTHIEDKPYKCDKCSSQFSHFSSLRQHKRIKHRDNSELLQQKSTNTEDKPYKCDKYYSSFSQYESLKLQDKPYKCDKYYSSFSQYESLKLHKKYMHTGSEHTPFRCCSCGKQFEIRSSLLWHTMKQSCGKQPNGRRKGDTLNVRMEGIAHIDKQSTGEEVNKVDKLHECNICSKQFITVSHLREHKKGHKRVKLLAKQGNRLTRERKFHPYRCDVCGEEFTKLMQLSKHKLIHTEDKPYKCDLCNEEFMQSFSLSAHKRQHHHCISTAYKKVKIDGVWHTRLYVLNARKPYRCDECGKNFKWLYEMSRHKEIHINRKLGISPYRCDVCDKQYTTSSHLSRHRSIHIDDERIHKKDEPYKCDNCGKRFTQKCNLSTHNRIHTKDRPYKCDICGKQFIYCGYLLSHRHVHTNDNPYKCDICGKQFKYKRSMSRHKHVHTNDNPYKCDICGKQFKYKSSLLRHKHIHTKD